jgi:hypothetical protein
MTYTPRFKVSLSQPTTSRTWPWGLTLAALLIVQRQLAWAKKEYISTDPLESIANACARTTAWIPDLPAFKGDAEIALACHANADPDKPPSAPDDPNANGNRVTKLYRTNPDHNRPF